MNINTNNNGVVIHQHNILYSMVVLLSVLLLTVHFIQTYD